MSAANVLLIMSDEHRRDALSCAQGLSVSTPHLDALAARGTRYTAAYTNCPLCAPSRASMATGRYVHEIAAWDNLVPYAGAPESWGHLLTSDGVRVATVGRLDFGEGDDGFPEQHATRPRMALNPAVALDSKSTGRREEARSRVLEAGPGNHHVERTVAETAAAIAFLKEVSTTRERWVLWLNYFPPHFPLQAPPEWFDLYGAVALDPPVDHPSAAHHPIVEELRSYFGSSGIPFDAVMRARRAYFGLCSYLDAQIGRVLAALDECGLRDDTLVIYTSDHGDMLGDHELWWKSSMYEPSVGVPLIVAGAGVEAGAVERAPVSLVDVAATVVETAGGDIPPAWPGRSLRVDGKPDAPVLSEYFAQGVTQPAFMLRRDDFKYIYYPHQAPQLFNLADDPQEVNDLGTSPKWSAIRNELDLQLRLLVDPETVARSSQSDRGRRLRDATADQGVSH